MLPVASAPPNAPAVRASSGSRFVAAVRATDPVLGVLLLALVVYYCAQPGIFEGKASGDGLLGYLYLPNLLYHHTFDLLPSLEPSRHIFFSKEITGHVANPEPLGPVLVWAPTWLLGQGLEWLYRLLAHAPPPGLLGVSPFGYWMAGLGALGAGLAGLALLFRLLARWLGTQAARVGVVVGVCATPLCFYVTVQPLYQHACAFFAVMLLIERWDAWRDALTSRRLACLGLIGGLAAMMRLQEAIFLLLPGSQILAGGLRAVRARDGRAFAVHVVGGLALTLGFLVAVAPQLALWLWYYGHLRTPQPPGYMRWLNPALVESLFSMRSGLCPWMPVFYLVPWGLWLARRRLGAAGAGLALLFLVELWVNASAWDFHGSWSFGPRRYTDATVTFAAGVAGLWWWAERRRWPRRVLAALLVFFVGWNLLLGELVRERRINSSGAPAQPASWWVERAHGPRWLGALFDRVGYPFVQPAGWLWSLAHHVPVRSFEGVVGSYFLERDWKVRSAARMTELDFAHPGELVPEGLRGGAEAGGAAPVGERVRVLVPLMESEPLELRLVGDFGGREAAVRAQWNGEALGAEIPHVGELRFQVPAAWVRSRSRTNELVLSLPAGTRLAKLEPISLGTWWRP